MVADPWQFHHSSGSKNVTQGPEDHRCWCYAHAHPEHIHVTGTEYPCLVRHRRLNAIPTVKYLNRPATFTSLVKLFSEPQYLTSTKDEEDPHAAITVIDYEEQTAGYQAAYSKLAASESIEVDPAAYVRDPQQYLGEQLVLLSKRQGQQLKAMLSTADPVTVKPFVQALSRAGYVL